MRWTPIIIVLLCAGGAVGWNASRFAGAQAQVRSKDLTFLPGPEVARVLAAGHPTTVAKLRWIDSFAYFQRQLEQDRADDRTAAGGPGGMERLYTTLIALDPRYEPFYQHALLNVGGLLGRRGPAIGYLLRGTMEVGGRELIPAWWPRTPLAGAAGPLSNPAPSMALWRSLLAELLTGFDLEARHPAQVAALLDQWAAVATTEAERAQVWQWRAAMGRRQRLGVSEVGYWQDQLLATPRGAPTEAFLLDSVRDAAARVQLARLDAILAAASAAGIAVARIEDAVRAPTVRAAFPAGLPPLTPLSATGALLADAYGLPFRLASATAAISGGLERRRFDRLASGQSVLIAQRAVRDGRWPGDLAEALTWTRLLPPQPPAGGRYRFDGRVIAVDWPPAPGPAWDPRAR